MIEEEMFLGLRKKNGVSIERFQKKFGQTLEEVYGAVIAKLKIQKMLFEADGRIRMTEKGFELGNEVFEQFLLD